MKIKIKITGVTIQTCRFIYARKKLNFTKIIILFKAYYVYFSSNASIFSAPKQLIPKSKNIIFVQSSIFLLYYAL